ncbi:MAG: N-acetylmuramidase family protein [Draconibacterium sp.]
MNTVKIRSRGPEVLFLNEILEKLGYKVYVSDSFGADTDLAVRDFQLKNNLIVDGQVGLKTWTKLIEKDNLLKGSTDKFLSENDLRNFASSYNLELAAVKAVNEVESSGKGFLVVGKPRILFEGHVFWRELVKRNIDPKQVLNSGNQDILYEKWTRQYYKGGAGEYERLERAISISPSAAVKEAAYCSASWGAFQIMGYHYKNIGYDSVFQFVEKMSEHEREHLDAFGRFISVASFSGKKLISWLREKDWESFANGYNGSGYKQNKYDIKLQKAYEKYMA